MKIALGFSTTDSFISRAIRWFIDSQVSHTYIRIYDSFLHAPLVIHADWPGVIFEHLDIFKANNIIIEEYEIDDERLHKGFKKNLKHLRKQYDWWNLLRSAVVLKLKRWIKLKARKPLEDPKKFVCVDFCVKVLNDSGITHLPEGELHPKSLRKWALDNYEDFGWKRVMVDDGTENKPDIF